MKTNHILMALGLATAAFSLQSCLDYDTPGDEFNSTTTNVKKVTNRGDVSRLEFKKYGTQSSVMTVSIANAIGLTAEQLDKITDLTEKQEKLLKEFGTSKKEEPAEKETMQQVAKKLTPEQCQKLEFTDKQLSNIKLTEKEQEAYADFSEKQVRAIVEKQSENLATVMSGQYWMRGGKNAERPGAHAYQYQFSNGVDILSQYGVIPHTFFTYAKVNISSAYDISDKFYGGAMGSYKGLANAFTPFLNSPESDSIPEIKAAFLLLLDYASIEVADIYGPMPYTDIKTNKQDSPYTYESVQTIYNKVKEDIDSIVSCFTYFDGQHVDAEGKMVDNKNAKYKKAIFDCLSNYEELTILKLMGYNNLDAWKRLANSLKLRMAMHIVKVDASLAKQWAEEAVASGVIETKETEFALRPSLGFAQPLLGVYEWGDERMTASMESLLKSLKHPYLKNLFKEVSEQEPLVNENNPNEITKSGVHGMRSGARPGMNQGYDGNHYIGFSSLNRETFSQAPLYIMKMSEVAFLRAEGAVRGWNMGGSAEEFYNKGILTASYEDRDMPSSTYPNWRNFYDVEVEDYMKQEEATPFTYHDPMGQTPDIESVTKIGVKWNEADNNETKLEKIITQKYIAGFPYSFEAYVDLRRTGYPKLFPVLNTEDCSFGVILPGQMIRRLPFPGRNDAATMKDIETTGLKALGGPDECNTRLWWDIEKSNF